MSFLDFRLATLALASIAIAHGTYFSLRHNTYLDTSDPVLTVQAHAGSSSGPSPPQPAVSGAECGLHLGPGSFVPIPASFCVAGLPVTRAAHPELFPLVLVFGPKTDLDPPFVPRLCRGHDVSGHVFLLTLAVLFLADQLRQTRNVAHV
ncbi:hypothetical protein EDB89DRAFT_2077252 [Lactarius sanguifluus]|nr:hypothetical protein EDB89DRAFT_2077252 [Lactarius sanguifluus]